MLIMCDIDSTLYDADKLFGDLAEEAGIKWPRRDNGWKTAAEILKTDGSECTRDDLVKVFRKAHSREYVSQQKPYPHAVKVIQSLAEYEKVEIAFVSDRNEQQTGALRDWLDANGFLANEDSFVAATADKRDWMREKRPSIVIDDRIRTMLFSRFELQALVVGLQHNHNINLKGEADNIWIAKDWKEIGELLHGTLIPKLEGKLLSRV